MSKTEETTKGKKPSHIAYHVQENNQKSYWTRIGAAWPNKKGTGYNIQLDCAPLDGKISLLIPTEKE